MKNKLLKKNLKVLKQVNPELAKWLTGQEDTDWHQTIQSSNGDANILIKAGNEVLPAYCMKNPKAEAAKAANTMALHKENVSVVIGLGLGYLANTVLSKMEKGHRILVVEPTASIIKLALKNFDFTSPLRNRDLIIIAPGKEELAGAIHFISNQFVISNWLITVDKYTSLKPDVYGELIKATSEIINQIMCNIGTIAGAAGAKIADNDIQCLPHVIRHRGVAELKDMYRDKPAVLVSTGPSLAKNIHHLIGVQDKIVIIAVGQALRVLLAYDIRPDFICTVDFGEVNMGHFEGLMDCGVPLVTNNRAYAPLLKAWQGPKFVAATPVPGFEHMATGILTDKGFIEAGGSVAHLCFGLAKLLGCNPIIFVGQDLALGKTSHIAQADATGEVRITPEGQISWKVEDHRCSLHGDKEFSMGPIVQTPGYYGATVLTNLGLASFLTTFEAMVEGHLKENQKIVINATEGGACIKGTTQLPLRRSLDKYCTHAIDKAKIQPLLTLAKDGDELITRVIPLLQNDISALDEIILQSRRGLATSRGLKGLMARPSYKTLLSKKNERLFSVLLKEATQESEGNFVKANQLFYKRAIAATNSPKLKNILILSNKNFQASEAAHAGATQNPLVNLAVYGASRTIQGRQLKAKQTLAHFLRDPESAQIRIKRNAFILKAAKNASESLKKLYEETLCILKEYDKTKNPNLLTACETEPVNLDDAENYFAAGNWAHPLLDAKKAMDSFQHKIENAVDEARIRKAFAIWEKAILLRDDAIKKAKADETQNADKRRRLVRYNAFLEESKRLGREDGKFNDALEMLKRAAELMPEETEARWGVATALHHSGQIDESLKEYKKLVKDFPDNPRFQFEYGQVFLRNNDLEKGLQEVESAMGKTKAFDSFLARVGEIYDYIGMPKKALAAYTAYLEAYPAAFEVWGKKYNCLTGLGQKDEAKEAYEKALAINPDYKPTKKGIDNL